MREGALKEKEEFKIGKLEEQSGIKRLGFGKQHVRYTITEAIKIFQIALQKENIGSAKSATFWLDVERKQVLPKRTADSLRNFWKTTEKKGLENYMRTALETNTWYCHAFCKIPKIILYSADNMTGGDLERELLDLADRLPKPSLEQWQHQNKIKKISNHI